MTQDRPPSPSRREALAMLVLQGAVLGLAACGTGAAAQEASAQSFAAVKSMRFPDSTKQIHVADRDGATLIDAGADPLDAAGEGYWWTSSNGGARRWKLAAQPIMSPEMFGAPGDGKRDDAAALTAALGFLARSGGGTLRFRPKRYRLATIADGTDLSTTAYRASIGIPGAAHDIRIELNGATLAQACDAFSIGPQYRLFNDDVLPKTTLRMTGAPRRGERSVRLASPPRLAPGSMVMVVAGNLNKRAYIPIAELQRVAAVEGETVSFEEPLAKDYDDDGRSPFGLIDVGAHSIRNFAILGPGRIVNSRRRAGNILQVMNLDLRDVRCDGRGGLGIRGRHLTITGCSAYIDANWTGERVFRPYVLALDTGTSNALIKDFVGDGGDNVAYLHLHEGLADVRVENIKLYNGTSRQPGAAPVGAISILGTSWNVTIDGALIVNNPQGAGIEAREQAAAGEGNRGLVIRNVRLEGTFAQAPLVIRDHDPAIIADIDLSGATRAGGKTRMVVSGALHRVSGIVGID